MLNILKVLFTVYFQVSRRSHQSSPAKAQKTAIQETPASDQSVKESKVDDSELDEETVQQTPDTYQNVCSNVQSNSSPAGQDSPPQRTDKSSTPFKKPSSSSKRLLAPSFFSKKS